MIDYLICISMNKEVLAIMTKKYYWLKLKENFFDDETIRYIEEQKNGILYSNFYLKLCLKSLRYDGKISRVIGNKMLPCDEQFLSRLTGVKVKIVKEAIQLFKNYGVIEFLDTGEIYISQIDEMIGKETEKAEIMRRKRAKEKNEVSNNVTEVLPKCYTEKEIEKEIEGEKEANATPTPSANASLSTYLSNVEYQKYFFKFYDAYPRHDYRDQALSYWLDQHYSLDDIDNIMKGVEWYKEDLKQRSKEAKSPLYFLKDETWKDRLNELEEKERKRQEALEEQRKQIEYMRSQGLEIKIGSD